MKWHCFIRGANSETSYMEEITVMLHVSFLLADPLMYLRLDFFFAGVAQPVEVIAEVIGMRPGMRQWNQCTFRELRSFLISYFQTLCVYSCRGALSTLFSTSPDWNWSLRLWATGKETDLIRCRGAAGALGRHLNCLSVRSRLCRDAKDMIHMFNFVRWETISVCTVCTYSVIRHSHCYCIPVL